VSRDHENLIEKTVWQYENFILGNGVGGGGGERGTWKIGRLEDWTIGKVGSGKKQIKKHNTVPACWVFFKKIEKHIVSTNRYTHTHNVPGTI